MKPNISVIASFVGIWRRVMVQIKLFPVHKKRQFEELQIKETLYSFLLNSNNIQRNELLWMETSFYLWI